MPLRRWNKQLIEGFSALELVIIIIIIIIIIYDYCYYLQRGEIQAKKKEQKYKRQILCVSSISVIILCMHFVVPFVAFLFGVKSSLEQEKDWTVKWFWVVYIYFLISPGSAKRTMHFRLLVSPRWSGTCCPSVERARSIPISRASWILRDTMVWKGAVECFWTVLEFLSSTKPCMNLALLRSLVQL